MLDDPAISATPMSANTSAKQTKRQSPTECSRVTFADKLYSHEEVHEDESERGTTPSEAQMSLSSRPRTLSRRRNRSAPAPGRGKRSNKVPQDSDASEFFS